MLRFKEKVKGQNIKLLLLLLVPRACPALCDRMGSPGPSAYGILQARILDG